MLDEDPFTLITRNRDRTLQDYVSALIFVSGIVIAVSCEYGNSVRFTKHDKSFVYLTFDKIAKRITMCATHRKAREYCERCGLPVDTVQKVSIRIFGNYASSEVIRSRLLQVYRRVQILVLSTLENRRIRVKNVDNVEEQKLAHACRMLIVSILEGDLRKIMSSAVSLLNLIQEYVRARRAA